MNYAHLLKMDREALEVDSDLSRKIEGSDFDYVGFLYASLMKIRRVDSVEFVPVKRLLASLLEFKAKNPNFFIKHLGVDEVKHIINNSDRMLLVKGSFVAYKTNYRIEENVKEKINGA